MIILKVNFVKLSPLHMFAIIIHAEIMGLVKLHQMEIIMNVIVHQVYTFL